MTRVKRGIISKYKHKKILKFTKGFRGRRKNVFRIAKQALFKSWQYSYRDRKNKKRLFRNIWIKRINIILNKFNIKYNIFINKMKKKNIILNRKILSDLAIKNTHDFKKLIKKI
ncbi:50S ribosomal subunit protein L20 [Candidatus Zinderia insecticola CARI]|uniref:Large ribosomal subunit protein bL20 n=1 Tax=Zinderia insecticola (strain CARI) TaxID=871271 RepID=E0TIM9_ZINIC|nr:50S ribosomal subunit protein L20 [Candidatus Zinderia insecticola CARI]